MPKPYPELRRARRADLSAIRRWLADEEKRGVHGCFHCNLHAVENSFRRRELTVNSEAPGEPPVGFYVGNEWCLDILEVHDRYRGRGYGELLAIDYLNALEASGAFGVVIECRPETSASFWESFGFKMLDDDDYRMVYVVRRQRRLQHETGIARLRLYDGERLVETKLSRIAGVILERDFVV